VSDEIDENAKVVEGANTVLGVTRVTRVTRMPRLSRASTQCWG
jgi:hypothetical protein